MARELFAVSSMCVLLVACVDDTSTDDTQNTTAPATSGPSTTGDTGTGPDASSTGGGGGMSTGPGLDTSTGGGAESSSGGPDPVCGNGVLEGDEKCDGDDLGDWDCLAQGFEGGTLLCNDECKLDTSECFFFICGNGTVQGDEICDGDEVGGVTCLDLGMGFDSGTVVCNEFCTDYDTSGCGTCGNLIVDGDEICEVGDIPAMETCDLYGYDSGDLSCTDCAIDTISCGLCGNGTRDGDESCDGVDLGGATCAGIGLGGGTLGCTAGCSFDFMGCDDQFGIACDPNPPNNCFVAAFMADAGGIPGNFYAMSLDGTQTIDYGPLGYAITGLAFHPDGTLYGVDPVNGQLVTIDLMPVNVNVIGPLQTAAGITHTWIPDIAFMGTQLVGWTESSDDFVLIDHTTGQITVVPSPQGSYGTGLAYNSDTDEVLLAPSGSNGILYSVSAMGAVMPGPTLGGVQSVVRGLAYDNGLLYGFDTGFGVGGNFVTYDPATGAMNVLGPAPSANIDSVAIYDLGNLAP